MKLPSAVLFDLDGTLVDTEPLWLTGQRRLAETHGTHWDPRVGHEIVGVGLLEGAELLAKYTGVNWEPAAIVDYLIDFVRAGMLQQRLEWFPGVPDFFSLLQRLQIPAAIVTSSYRSLAEVVVEAAPLGLFSTVVSGDEVVNAKPHPEPYLTAATHLDVAIGRCLVIEDSPPGVASGLAAGAMTVAIPKVIPIPPASGLSRLRSAEELTEATLRRLAAGEILDTLEVEETSPFGRFPCGFSHRNDLKTQGSTH